MVNNKTKTISFLALLAAVNCSLELTLGSYLHLIRFPFTGQVMTGLDIIIYILVFWVCPKPGSITLVAFIDALGNLYFGGSFKPFALSAIFFEGFIVDVIISLLGFRKMSFRIASVAISLFSFVYPLLTLMLFYGKPPQEAWWNLILKLFPNLKATFPVIGTVITGLLIFHIITAIIFADLGWKILRRMEQIIAARACALE
jgi:ABC-type thiamin/hydroxymethylpyrimidine transport system permease subunit